MNKLPLHQKMENLAKVLEVRGMPESAKSCLEASKVLRPIEEKPHPASKVDIAGIPNWLLWAITILILLLVGAAAIGATWLVT